MTPRNAESTGLLLRGLDGGNPLAFLAALGVLRTLDRAGRAPDAPDWLRSGVVMSWAPSGVAWVPVIHCLGGAEPSPDEFLAALEQALATDMGAHPLSCLERDGDLKDTMRACASGATWQDRENGADWLSALCSDLIPEATNRVQTVRRDYFLGNLRTIIAATKGEHLRRALFVLWDYADPLDNQSLHIEPAEDRRHAYQWHKPSGDPTRSKRGGMLGANRLAVEALPFMQSFAAGKGLATRGFTGQRTDDTRWTWPIWSCRLGGHEVSSLLSLPDLQSETLDAGKLRARGVAKVFRCWRILVEKTPNFTLATAVI